MGRFTFSALTIATLVAIGALVSASPFESGNQRYAEGDFPAAITHFATAAAEFGQAGKGESQAAALYNLALAHQAAGQFKLAIEAIGKASELAPDERRIAALAATLGVYGRGGDVAPSSLRSQFESAIADGDLAAAAGLANDYAVLLGAEGQHEAARSAFDQGEKLAANAKLRSLAAKIPLNRAMMHLDAASNYLDEQGGIAGDWDPRGDEPYQSQLRAAADDLATAYERGRWLADGFDKPLVLTGVGDAYAALARARTTFETKANAKQFASYRAALAAAKQTKHPVALSHALGRIGELYEKAGRSSEALDITRRARDLAASSNASDALFRWDWQLGRLLAAKGEQEDALAAYRRAKHVLGGIRHDVAIAHGRNPLGRSFREVVGGLYFEMADLLLSTKGSEDEMQALFGEARLVIEAYKSAELEDYFQDECVNLALAASKGVEEVEPGTAVFYVIPLEGRTEILVEISGRITRFRSNITAAELESAARVLRSGLESDGDPSFMAPARSIYDALVRPTLDLLKTRQVDTLVFVPDGALRTVPMGALHDGERYLIERFAIAVSPGLQLMEPKRIPRENVQMLIGALSEAVQDFPALPAVRGEVQSLSNQFKPAPVVMADSAFLKDPFRTDVREQPYQIVHIASHGEFGKTSSDSFVLTYDGRIDLDELEAAIRPRKFQGEPVELLGLSACRTAAGDDRAALGLAGVAVKSGARSAFATLWYVDDAVSGALVSDFYGRLSEDPEITKAEALRQAQLEIMKDIRYAHPRAWAPYLIIGNWL